MNVLENKFEVFPQYIIRKIIHLSEWVPNVHYSVYEDNNKMVWGEKKYQALVLSGKERKKREDEEVTTRLEWPFSRNELLYHRWYYLGILYRTVSGYGLTASREASMRCIHNNKLLKHDQCPLKILAWIFLPYFHPTYNNSSLML